MPQPLVSQYSQNIQELGLHIRRLFAVPRDEILDALAPAAQVIVQH